MFFYSENCADLYVSNHLMRNKKILYVSQEITPYLKDSAIGDACRLVPHKVQEQGYEVRAFMPKYGCINERRNQLHEVIRLSGANISIDDNDHPLILKVATLQASKMQVYFIDNDDYFQRHSGVDLEIHMSPDENDERLIFFTRSTMDTVKKLRWEPSVIHCSGWISALTPMFVKQQYADDPTIGPAKVVVSLFDDHFDGTLDVRFVEKLLLDGIAEEHLAPLAKETSANWLNLYKLAIRHADGVVLTSDKVPAELIDYAKELNKPIVQINTHEFDAPMLVDFYESL